MTDTDNDGNCYATTMHDGNVATCERFANHPGVHLGKIPTGPDELEVIQWTDAESLDREKTWHDELPLWAGVLPPVSTDVQITTTSRRTPTLCGELHGVVLREDGEPSAVVLSEGAEGSQRRVLVPWSTVETFGWEVDQ